MEAVLKLPIDYQQSLVFRRLEEWFAARRTDAEIFTDVTALAVGFNQGRAPVPPVLYANHVYTTIWADLAYLAKEGRDPGRVTPEEAPIIKKILAVVTVQVDELYAALSHSIRLFFPDHADLICVEFASLNGHLHPGMATREAKGGIMKKFYATVKEAKEDAFQQMLLIPTDRLVDGEGVPLPAETVRRMKWLVASCDGALRKPTRPPYLYSADLIANAVAVLAQFNDGEALEICKCIAESWKDKRLVGMTTEKLLPEFGGIMRHLKGMD